jgi:hypothetical protein
VTEAALDGTVVILKRRGCVVEMTSPTDEVVPGTEFTVHRTVDGQEVLVGTGASRRAMPPNRLKLNPRNGEVLECQVGDVVRSV